MATPTLPTVALQPAKSKTASPVPAPHRCANQPHVSQSVTAKPVAPTAAVACVEPVKIQRFVRQANASNASLNAAA